MRIVIAPDKFKGSLDAPSAARAIAEGVRRADPGAEMVVAPMADGGEGTAEIIAEGSPAARSVDIEVTGPLPSTRALGRIWFIGDGREAVLDMASAAGFSLLSSQQRDPTRTTTYGVGELICYATERGARRIFVGLGGSATCDGGIGAAQAMGAKIELEGGLAGSPVTGADLLRIRRARFDTKALGDAAVVCLHDVDNPLLGQRGTARVFAHQKGANAPQVEELEAGLQHLVGLLGATELAQTPGMGSAGGLGLGLHLAVGAQLRPGAAAVAKTIGLDAKLDGADACFTGEGRLDATSLGGKATGQVARLCRSRGVACYLLAGSFEAGLALHEHGITGVHSTLPDDMSVEEALPRAHELLASAAERLTRIILGRASRPGQRQ